MHNNGMTLKLQRRLLGLAKKQFVTIRAPKKGDWAKAKFGTNANPTEVTCARGEVVNGFAAMRDGEVAHEGGRVCNAMVLPAASSAT